MSVGNAARLGGMVALTATLLAACSPQYRVRADHLRRAQRADIADHQLLIPALDSGGQPTNLRVSKIRGVVMTEYDDQGQPAVYVVKTVDHEARLLWTGGIMTVVSAIGLAFTLKALSGDEGDLIGLHITNLVLTTTAIRAGIVLLIVGLNVDSTESSRTSPGFNLGVGGQF